MGPEHGLKLSNETTSFSTNFLTPIKFTHCNLWLEKLTRDELEAQIIVLLDLTCLPVAYMERTSLGILDTSEMCSVDAIKIISWPGVAS